MLKAALLNPSIDISWQPCLATALEKMDQTYLQTLNRNINWLPGAHHLFNAFSIPLHKVNYVLFGESPYPREVSANGYAFWDANVKELWSSTGLSKTVNRATSLRNIIKMLLVAEGLLNPMQTQQPAIAKIDKKNLIQTNSLLFQHLLDHGFLLLNASLVLSDGNVRKEAVAWAPFIKHILDFLHQSRPDVCFILFGNIAHTIDPLIRHADAKRLYSEHPYNISFIQNQVVLDFFAPLHLLRKTHLSPLSS